MYLHYFWQWNCNSWSPLNYCTLWPYVTTCSITLIYGSLNWHPPYTITRNTIMNALWRVHICNNCLKWRRWTSKCKQITDNDVLWLGQMPVLCRIWQIEENYSIKFYSGELGLVFVTLQLSNSQAQQPGFHFQKGTCSMARNFVSNFFFKFALWSAFAAGILSTIILISPFR